MFDCSQTMHWLWRMSALGNCRLIPSAWNLPGKMITTFSAVQAFARWGLQNRLLVEDSSDWCGHRGGSGLSSRCWGLCVSRGRNLCSPDKAANVMTEQRCMASGDWLPSGWAHLFCSLEALLLNLPDSLRSAMLQRRKRTTYVSDASRRLEVQSLYE